MRSRFLHFIIFFLLIVVTHDLHAAHIVGGDFSYRHISGDTYEIKMKMYRDCGGGGAPFENVLFVSVFDKGSNQAKKINSNATC